MNMDAIIDDVYVPAVYRVKPKTTRGVESGYTRVRVSPAMIHTWDGEYLTKSQLEARVTNLQPGDKKQIRALNLLQFFEACRGEKVEVYLAA